ncbi:MAG TPA: DUF2062 domain-containing protein [Candidatus Moranbacteria bacterium]|nr:DUF2062 domain-containing protein [Candidatus Moranbacteria bacterium]HRZ33833.1 DUF2062 domain-containing protein [Candidatus Moranbacteria bacterium]
MIKDTYQKIRAFFLKFFTLKDTPHKIAAGFALGIFLGIIPGEGITAAIVLATIFRFNRASATSGALATNMWGTIATLPLAAAVGGFLFNVKPSQLVSQFDQTYHLGYRYFLSKVIFLDLALPVIIGFIIVAGAISILFYAALYFLLKYNKIK